MSWLLVYLRELPCFYILSVKSSAQQSEEFVKWLDYVKAPAIIAGNIPVSGSIT